MKYLPELHLPPRLEEETPLSSSRQAVQTALSAQVGDHNQVPLDLQDMLLLRGPGGVPHALDHNTSSTCHQQHQQQQHMTLQAPAFTIPGSPVISQSWPLEPPLLSSGHLTQQQQHMYQRPLHQQQQQALLGVAPLQHVNQHLKQDVLCYQGSGSACMQPGGFHSQQQQQQQGVCYDMRSSGIMRPHGSHSTHLEPHPPALMGGTVAGIPISHHMQHQQQQSSEAMSGPAHQQPQQQLLGATSMFQTGSAAAAGPPGISGHCPGVIPGMSSAMSAGCYGVSTSRCQQQQGGMLPPSSLGATGGVQLPSYNSGSFSSGSTSYGGLQQQHQQRLPALNMNCFGSASEQWAKVLASPGLQPSEISQLLALMGGGEVLPNAVLGGGLGLGGLPEDQSGAGGGIRSTGSGDYPSGTAGMRQ